MGKHDEAIAKMNADCRPLLAALVKTSDDYRDYTLSRAATLTETAEADYVLHRNLLILGCLIAFLSAGISGALITRSLTRALGAEPDQLSTAAQRVAQGDLSKVEGVAAAPKGSVPGVLGRHAGQPGRHRRTRTQQQRQHCHRLGADRHRQCRSEPAHRRAGEQPPTDCGVHGGADGPRSSRTQTRRDRQPSSLVRPPMPRLRAGPLWPRSSPP